MTKDPKTAVALGYDRERDAAPQVLAKGRGAIAEQIIAIAEQHGIHVHHDEDLVEVLERLDISAPIPVEAFAAVAEVLVHLYKLNDEMGMGQ